MPAPERVIAEQLGDGQIVTYRILSRLAGIRVNEAKQSLAAYRDSHAKVHATYLISGTGKAPVQTNGHGGEDQMDVDAPAQVEERIERSVCKLARSEDLEACKATFESVRSTHIYSLESSSPKDLSMLTAANQALTSDPACIAAWAKSRNGTLFGLIEHPTRAERKLAKPVKAVKTEPPVASTSKKPVAKRKVAESEEDIKPVILSKNKGRAVIESDEEDSDASPAPKPSKSSTKSEKPKRSKSGRLVRTIQRTYRNERGMKVTEDIEESYSESEQDAKPKKPVKPPSKPKDGKDGASKPPPKPKGDKDGQTSLASFFGKK